MIAKFFILAVTLILEGVILYALMWLIKKILLRTVIKDVKEDDFLFYFKIIATIIWIIFVVYGVYSYAKLSISLGIVAGATLILGFRFFMNLILGIIYKFQNGNNINVKVSIGNMEGVIAGYGFTSVLLKEQGGDIKKIPYYDMYSGVITITSVSKANNSEVLILKGSEYKAYNSRLEEIKKKIALIPYVSVNKDIKLSYSEKDDIPSVKVEFYVCDASNTELVKQKIRALFV